MGIQLESGLTGDHLFAPGLRTEFAFAEDRLDTITM
jgi:hypothetical protein